MTHGTIAGEILRDLILDKHHQWSDLYSPTRVSLASSGVLASENFNTALHYTDWLTASGTTSEKTIEPGTGALLNSGLSKVAAYRDLEGDLHKMSAACPHMGGLVAWNAAEKTWDCPCHGSRFDCQGHVLNGPAMENLKPL